MLSIKDIGGDLAADMTQQITSRIGAKMAADIEAALEAAIKDYLGIMELDVDSMPAVLRKRMFAAHMPDGTTEYRIDDQPILRIGPLRMELVDGVLNAARDVWRPLSMRRDGLRS